MRAEPMKGAILHVQSNYADALAVLHDEVERKVLDEEVGVMSERLAVQRMQQRVSSTIGSRSTTVGLATLAILQ